MLRRLHTVPTMNVTQTFKNISEWIKAGHMETGFYHVSAVKTVETEKAIGIHCKRLNEFGNLKPSVCWLPKAKIQFVSDDFYDHKNPVNVLVPRWLFSAKTSEGFEF